MKTISRLAFQVALMLITCPLTSARAVDSRNTGASAEPLTADKILNGRIEPQWLDDHRFWYTRRASGIIQIVLIDAAHRVRREESVTGFIDIEQSGSRIERVIAYQPGRAFEVLLENEQHFVCSLVTRRCDAVSDDRPELPTLAPIRSNFYNSPKRDLERFELISPNGKLIVFARAHNLWVRDVRTGVGRQLTYDGVEKFAYGAPNDDSLGIIASLATARLPLTGVDWSPDSLHLLVTRWDQRTVKTYPFVAFAPRSNDPRPELHPLRIPMLGEAAAKRHDSVINIVTGANLPIQLPKGWLHDEYYDVPAQWDDSGKVFYTLLRSDSRHGALACIPLSNAVAKIVVDESAPGLYAFNNVGYQSPNVALLRTTQQAIVFSERSGWGHLYLHDLRRRRSSRSITSGRWLVRNLLAVDEPGHAVIVAGQGRDDQDPYSRRIYRVNLRDGRIRMLTPEIGDHGLGQYDERPAGIFSPKLDYFVDVYSSLKNSPKTVLRSARTGAVIMPLETADVTGIVAAGARSPIPITTMAADGKTSIYGAIFLPSSYDPTRKYPVIDVVYGGPQGIVAPHNYFDGVAPILGQWAFADSGYIVITADARGTAGRSVTFREAARGQWGDVGVSDHVAFLLAVAKLLPSADLTRVGIFGHSYGGYLAARAILSRPDIYTAAVSSAGPHDFSGMRNQEQTFWEIGAPDYGSGRALKLRSDERPPNYATFDNRSLATRLKGKLMIAVADLDENVPPGSTFALIDALEKAGKSFDLVFMTNRSHSFFKEQYFRDRVQEFFRKNLQ